LHCCGTLEAADDILRGARRRRRFTKSCSGTERLTGLNLFPQAGRGEASELICPTGWSTILLSIPISKNIPLLG
jgi:hypothetical protein